MSEPRDKKRIQFPRKPGADAWVAQGRGETVVEEQKTKRLTLDLPEGLHRAIKLRAVGEGVTMVDMLRKLLEEQYGGGE